MDATVIYHLTTVEEWEDAQDLGTYQPQSFQREGFIHCCTGQQLASVQERHFKGQENLVKLVIDPSLLNQKLQYDKDEQLQQEFPHIYGPLNLTAVIEIVFLEAITSDKENIDNKRKD
ncbi:MAG: DUF952 domain-containing protein [Bacteroidota bacterium]|nr:DUF952 domain-containing protein [Bacteroidota bacterium]